MDSSSTDGETRIHPEWLRRKFKNKRRPKTLVQTEPRTGNLGRDHSLPIRKISSHRSSIVDHLATRSVTGQSLDILVHQHVGFRVHFEWNHGRKAMERCFHNKSSDAETFCTELCKFGLEGLCACECDNYHSSIPENTPFCYHAPFYVLQKYLQEPTLWIKTMEEF
jgi:hypothetical protein